MDVQGRVISTSAEGWPYPQPPDDGAAAHLAAGFSLPAIDLSSTAGGTVSLAGLSGRAVIFIYPWTGSPGLPNPPGWDDIPGAHGSTPALTGVANLYTSFLSIGVQVLGVSGQTSADQAAFAARMALPFPLLSDADGRLAEALRLPTFHAGGTRYLSRLTLTAADGILLGRTYPVYPPHTHARAVLAELTASGSYAAEAAKFSPPRPPASPAD
jgi:peroxiredoxin